MTRNKVFFLPALESGLNDMPQALCMFDQSAD
jgi:hypothetical protein